MSLLGRVWAWALPAVILAILFGLASGSDALAWVARVGMIVYVVAEWRRQATMAKGVILFGIVLALLTVSLADAPSEALIEALDRFAFLGAFLACLGLLRVAAEDSPLMRQCGQYLIQQPPQRRYLTLSTGSGLFGIILNIGVLNLLGVMSLRGNTLAAAGGHQAVWQARRRRMFVAMLRGFAMVPLISPLGISLAVILSALPQLTWFAIAPYAFATAALMFVLGWLLDRLAAPKHLKGLAPERIRLSPRPLIAFCTLVAGIVALTFLLAYLMAVQLPVAVIFSAPLSALIWLALQRRRLGGGSGVRRAGLSIAGAPTVSFPACVGKSSCSAAPDFSAYYWANYCRSRPLPPHYTKAG
ncbi:hypothetical protein [Alkalilimnicola ehrlichii]|uniref:Uncharacterized protein n=1 Tax=Alkalilimnicola ehrlichii TaxID=351052 RepID=A0A3E0X3E0_9GAMM|nr:hypothetical protein [Alkalilimnicola ehrlichii]RFA39352.1 hypothetical protein CAL65_00620 [Alkalilimnicola ehrlichii]